MDQQTLEEAARAARNFADLVKAGAGTSSHYAVGRALRELREALASLEKEEDAPKP